MHAIAKATAVKKAQDNTRQEALPLSKLTLRQKSASSLPADEKRSAGGDGLDAFGKDDKIFINNI